MSRTTMMLVGASTLALAAPALAQSAPETPNGPGAAVVAPAQGPAEGSTQADATDVSTDIVVTAQRRAERVTDVPISITVASQAQLERQQVNTVNDLNRIAPSLETQQAPGQNVGGGGTLRGLGTQTFNAGATASVGLVVDQVSQGNTNITDLFDIGRVEVLKGPQGTLFGLTTSAGVINITTNAPDPNKVEVRLRSELSGAGTAGSLYGNQLVQGVVNLPLSGNAAVRVSGNLNRRQGPDRNAYTGDYSEVNRWGVRGRFLWEPSSVFTINLIGDYSYLNNTSGGDFFTFIRAGGPGPALGGAYNDPIGIDTRLRSCGVTPRVGNREYCTTDIAHGHTENFGTSLELDYSPGPVTVTSITSYRGGADRGTTIFSSTFRADPLALQVYQDGFHTDRTLFTQEVRLSSPSNQFFQYTVGGFYSHQTSDADPFALRVFLTPFPGLTIPIAVQPGAQNKVTDESKAVFGEATLHISRQFRVIAGARYTNSELDLNRRLVGQNSTFHIGQTKNQFSYRAGLQYDFANRWMAYATVSRGFKSGQVVVPTDNSTTPYLLQPEIPQDYEIGLKGTLFGSWVLDINAFYDKIRNFQAQQSTVDPVTAILNSVQTNIDGVKSRGFEVNLFGRVMKGLNVSTGFIVAKATYPGGFTGTDGLSLGGKQLAGAPRYKFTFSGDYEYPVTDAFKAFVAADAVWKSRVRYETNSVRVSSYLPHWVVGGRIGARTADDRFEVAVFARNLFNVHEPFLIQTNFPYNGADNVGAMYGPQSFRQIGLALGAKF